MVDTLKAAAVYDHTIVWFSSDNGAPGSGGFNFPLKGWKTQLWEGGVRAAAFVHSPLLPAAVHSTRNHKLFHISDILPTFVGLAGGNTKRNKPLDGADIWAAVTTSALSPRDELLVNLNPAAMSTPTPRFVLVTGNCWWAASTTR